MFFDNFICSVLTDFIPYSNFYYVQVASPPSKRVSSLLYSHQVRFVHLYSWLCGFFPLKCDWLTGSSTLENSLSFYQKFSAPCGVLYPPSFSVFNWYVLSGISSFLVCTYPLIWALPLFHPSCNDSWAVGRG